MQLALVCPDNFNNKEQIETILQSVLNTNFIEKILCATSHAYDLAQSFCEHNDVVLWHVKIGGKEKRLRVMVERSDKVIVFKHTIEDSTKYSRTRYALKYAQKLNKDLTIIDT